MLPQPFLHCWSVISEYCKKGRHSRIAVNVAVQKGQARLHFGYKYVIDIVTRRGVFNECSVSADSLLMSKLLEAGVKRQS